MDLTDPYDKTKTMDSSGRLALDIGPYRLLEKIGEGGMGEVWVAEQQKPIQRRVALKLIKAGMDTRQVIARFDSERQALALMDHPAIAKVFDAGETADGRPYFVMEYVQGIPVTAYCDRNRLTTEDRLELFRHICEGVQHAHQKAIIHRDLKPSNILVTIQDGLPVPKIIDFGVAKATAQALTERTLYTELGMLVGTPEYMSPEQAEMSGQNVDTRTDVYSLGTILYELLVGSLPFDPKELRRAGFDEIRRKIREDEPPRPSTKLSTMGEASTALAQARRTERPALIRQIRGDLDWITMKALEKDRTRRYGSPSDLAADIERHLEHQPVVARPPSAVYKARKFVRRHRFGVAVAGGLAALLVAFSVTTALQSRRIGRERDRANQEAETSKQVSDFLVNLFRVSDPGQARGNSITAREILEKGSAKIGEELAGQPLIQARIMETIGQVYQNLGLFRQAAPLLEKTLETRRKALGESHPTTGSSMINLAWLYISLRRTAEAESLVGDGIKILAAAPEVSYELSRGLAMLGMIQRDRGELAAARENLSRSLEICEKTVGPEHERTSYPLYHLGWLHKLTGEFDKAEHYYGRAYAIMERVLGPDHPTVLWCLNDRAVVADNKGDGGSARDLYAKALAAGERVLGPEHYFISTVLNNIGVLEWRQGNPGEAAAAYRRSMAIREKTFGPDHSYVAESLNNLVLVYQESGDYEQARRLGERALAINEKAGAETLRVAGNLNNLAIIDSFSGRYDQARARFDRALGIQEKILGPDHADVASLLFDYGMMCRLTGDLKQAAALYERALKIKERVFGPESVGAAQCLLALAKVSAAAGEAGRAEELYARAVAIYERIGQAEDPTALYTQARYWAAAGDRDRAMGFLKRSLEQGFKRAFFNDPDFSTLRGTGEFDALAAASRSRARID
jgi:non-specific serine/threonine protein kinase/serine/threonine-protein kinase